ncbi:MAG TPA: hypothetical protein VF179_11060 [Thermoanaerobaculia bacterium]|nr:hypothetical protein [Thermoanaerobaculia bacterium]
MKARWLAGAVLFALGFGCAFLVRLPAADAANAANAANTADVPAKEVAIEGTPLKYVDGQDFRVKVPAGVKTEYLIAVARKPGAGVTLEPQISAKTGEAVFSKKGLQTLTVFEVKPLIQWQSAPPPRATQKSLVSPSRTVRCGHPQIYCVLPPPPGPPIHVAYQALKSRLK